MSRKLLNGKMTGTLAVLLVLFMAAGVAGEERTDASGQWKYVLEDGSATITGYVEYPEGDLVIPSELDGVPVTGIGDDTFSYCNLSSVTIPAGVVEIGSKPFESCPLKTIEVAADNPVYEAVDGVLFDKQRKTLVIYPGGREADPYRIPDGVLRIGEYAFFACESLSGVVIPDSVTSIGDYAFLGCESLSGVVILNSVTDVGEYAFGGCEKLILTVQKGSYAEQYAEDEEIPYQYIVPESKLDASGQWYFVVEEAGATITNYVGEPEGDLLIPDELDGVPVTGIGESVFWYSNVGSVIIPAGVTHIAGDPFQRGNTRTLTLCAVEGSYAEQYARENEYAREYEIYSIQIGSSWQLDASGQWYFVVEEGGATITHYVWGPEVALVIPSELDGHPVTGIGVSACWYLWYRNANSLAIPSSVTYIAGDEFYIAGDAFYTADNPFYESDVLRFYVAEGSYAEQYARENYIRYGLVDTGWQWKYMPDWDGEDYEEGVVIYDYVMEPVGDLVFPSELDGYPVVGIGVCWGCEVDEKGALEGCANVTSVTIPDGVAYIYEAAFRKCGGLTSVTLSDSVTYISDGAFYNCDVLTSVAIPAGVEYIGNEAFEGCGELVLTVTEGSYAEEYAQENHIPYVLAVE